MLRSGATKHLGVGATVVAAPGRYNPPHQTLHFVQGDIRQIRSEIVPSSQAISPKLSASAEREDARKGRNLRVLDEKTRLIAGL